MPLPAVLSSAEIQRIARRPTGGFNAAATEQGDPMTAFGAKARLGLGIVIAGVVVASAVAQTRIGDLPAVLQRVLDCRKLTDDSRRLACYDAAVGEIAQSLTKGEIVAVDHEQIATVRRQAFGFSLPSLTLFDRNEKAPEERLALNVTSAREQPDGKWLLVLEGGATWVQTDQQRLTRYPKKGSKVEIRKAALGTYFMNIDGQRAIRVRRVE
jgi:hypothetical protein